MGACPPSDPQAEAAASQARQQRDVFLVLLLGVAVAGTLTKFALDLRGVVRRRDHLRSVAEGMAGGWSAEQLRGTALHGQWTYFPPTQT